VAQADVEELAAQADLVALALPVLEPTRQPAPQRVLLQQPLQVDLQPVETLKRVMRCNSKPTNGNSFTAKVPLSF
jgi:hypothetical protein